MKPAGAGLLLFLAFLLGSAPFAAGAATSPSGAAGGSPLLGLAVGGLIVATFALWIGAIRDQSDLLEFARQGATLFGVFWCLHLGWMLVLAIRLQAMWPLLAYVGQLLLLACLGALFGTGCHALTRRIPLPVAVAAAWVGVEWTRGHLLGPLNFPWSPLALPLTPWPALIQPAAWVGEAGLSAGVVLVSVLLAQGWSRHRRPEPGWRIQTGAAVLLAAVWWGAGEWRLAGTRGVPVVRAAVVQPAIPLVAKLAPEGAEARTRFVTDSLLGTLNPGSVAVIAFPETHLTDPVLDPAQTARSGVAAATGEEARWLRSWATRLEAQIVVGAYVDTELGRENAVVWISDAGVQEHRGKQALVPGVEWGGGDLVRSDDAAPLVTSSPAGVLVCVESAWSGLSRARALEGAQWLLNVTNDAWLGESPGWTRTPAFRQHPQHLVLRTVETGLGGLRVGNNGLTGVADPDGGWTLALEPHEPGVAVVEVRRLGATTLYSRLGDLMGPAAALMMALALVALRWPGSGSSSGWLRNGPERS